MIFPHERGGKRDARVASARAGLELVGAQADVRRLEVGHQVRKAYFAVLAAEQSFELTEESLSLTRSFAGTVAEKVRAGAVSPIEETRAAVRLHSASAEIERARREVALARADLALAVGDPGVRSEPLEGRLPEDTTIPDLAALTAQIDGSSDLKLLEREVLVRRSALAEQRTHGHAGHHLAGRRELQPSRSGGLGHRRRHDPPVRIREKPRRPRGRGGGCGAGGAGARSGGAATRRRAGASCRRVAGLRARGRHPQEQRARRRRAGLRHRAGGLSSREVPVPRRPRRLARCCSRRACSTPRALAALAQARIDVDRLLGKTSMPSTTSAR